MKTEPFPPMLPDNFEKMCLEWVSVIKAQESGTWIWPVLNAPHRRIWQFKEDLTLQQKLFGEEWEKQLLVYVDLKRLYEVRTESLHQLLKESINEQYSNIVQSFASNLAQLSEHLIKDLRLSINYFVTGADMLVRENKWEVLSELKFLAQKGWSTHVLLFLETDITAEFYVQDFAKLTTLAKNIFVTPLYTLEDVDTFVKYLCFNWEVEMKEEQLRWIDDNCGGHYWLVKDVVRQVKQSLGLKYEEIGGLSTLAIKAEAIVNELSEEQRSVLRGKVLVGHEVEFLKKQGWINSEGNLTVPYIAKFLGQTSKVGLSLTKQELKLFEYLQAHVNTLVTREAAAKCVWGEGWEEVYSNWALDQLVHRIRDKLEETSAFELKTKKGQGLVLSSK
jgi:hypothetical protein